MSATSNVVVGRVGRPHGVHGELSVEPRTDEPDRRFAVGAVLTLEAAARGAPGSEETRGVRPVTVEAARWHGGRLLVRLRGVGDRTTAQTLGGRLLSTDVDAAESPEDPEDFYDHQLVGLHVRVHGATDRVVGTVAEVLHPAGQDLLVVTAPDGREVLVPFVTALVPVVDVAAGRLEVVDRPGLLAAPEDA